MRSAVDVVLFVLLGIVGVLIVVIRSTDCRESAALNCTNASHKDESSESVPSAEAQDK